MKYLLVVLFTLIAGSVCFGHEYQPPGEFSINGEALKIDSKIIVTWSGNDWSLSRKDGVTNLVTKGDWSIKPVGPTDPGPGTLKSWAQKYPNHKTAVRALYENPTGTLLSMIKKQKKRPESVSPKAWSAWRAVVQPYLDKKIYANPINPLNLDGVKGVFGDIVKELK